MTKNNYSRKYKCACKCCKGYLKVYYFGDGQFEFIPNADGGDMVLDKDDTKDLIKFLQEAK